MQCGTQNGTTATAQHVLGTIAELERRITALTSLKTGLMEQLLSEPIPAPVQVKPAEPIQAERREVRPARAARAVRAGRPAKKTEQRPRVAKTPYITSAGALQACATLPQPFNAHQISVATGGSFKSATSMITRWADKGYIERAAYGKYRRTKAYPVANSPTEPQPASGPTPGIIRPPTPPATERVSIPGLDDGNITLEEKLEKALRDRDDASAAGKETLVRILQDKIDKLQAQLEARG